jgi:hypothetical protein
MRMPLTPKDLSFLAASASRAGSDGSLVTRKGYRPESVFLHVGRRPARFAGEHAELHQQHGLADAAEAGVDEAALARPCSDSLSS